MIKGLDSAAALGTIIGRPGLIMTSDGVVISVRHAVRPGGQSRRRLGPLVRFIDHRCIFARPSTPSRIHVAFLIFA
ncbi:hypothetical protein AB0C29_14935 [Actinoplanes sp. NPDC048791]|uniref:hypothetical protein n=1 Tax=Actinoplanes sp. NPDC048791 TaxID=3154623 RepID=UPI0033EDA8B5